MRNFAQLLFAGVALGSVYALVALGFTVIYRSSRVINFAQGELLAFGAFLTSWLVLTAGLGFWVALAVGAAVTASLGLAFEILVLRFAVGQPDFTVVMLTLGLAAALQGVVDAVWGSTPRANGDPWGASAAHVAGLVLNWDQISSIVTAALVLAAFAWFDRTRLGLAARAAASDQEAAVAVGISLRRVFALAWGLAGLVACIGGVFVAGYPASLDPTVSNVALLAFPAIILGGLDSTTGAVIGGFVIGVVQELTAGYQPQYAAWLGHNLYLAAPYVVMIVVLLVRPHGLLGTRPAERL